jgi:hypothetical protein
MAGMRKPAPPPPTHSNILPITFSQQAGKSSVGDWRLGFEASGPSVFKLDSPSTYLLDYTEANPTLTGFSA